MLCPAPPPPHTHTHRVPSPTVSPISCLPHAVGWMLLRQSSFGRSRDCVCIGHKFAKHSFSSHLPGISRISCTTTRVSIETISSSFIQLFKGHLNMVLTWSRIVHFQLACSSLRWASESVRCLLSSKELVTGETKDWN